LGIPEEVTMKPESPEHDKIVAFGAALEAMIRDRPARNFPKALQIVMGYESLGFRQAMREVAIAQSKVPRKEILALEKLIFG
jgi:hypothetical protein